MRNLFLTLALFGAASCVASPDAKHTAPTVWSLRGAQKIARLTTDVVGAPKAVLAGKKSGVVFDGKGDGIFVPANPLAGWPEFTIEVRFKPDGTGNEEQRFLHIEDDAKHRILMETRTRDGQWSLDTFLHQDADHRRTLLDRALLHPADRWYWVALVYDGKKMSSYVNGVLELEGDVEFAPMSAGRTSLGVRQNLVSWFKGAIAEVRFTPKALPPKGLKKEKSQR